MDASVVRSGAAGVGPLAMPIAGCGAGWHKAGMTNTETASAPRRVRNLGVLNDTGRSVVGRTIRKLVELSLTAKEGDYLGSEADLMAMFEVSRPTLRQAAKVVASDQLVSIRRGMNGGFYASRPDARHVVQAPALWLRLKRATMEEMNAASTLILAEAAGAAVKCEDPALVAQLGEFRDRIQSRMQGAESEQEAIQQEIKLADLVKRMSGNPVFMLFGDIAYAFGLLDRDFSFHKGSEERRQAWLQLQLLFCNAILTRDGEVARLLGQRRGRLMADWLQQDTKNSNADVPYGKA